MVAEGIALELCCLYPGLHFRSSVEYVDGTVQISSESGIRIILIGSRVMLTCGPVRTPPPQYFIPDIDLSEPGSFERILDWIDRYWLAGSPFVIG